MSVTIVYNPLEWPDEGIVKRILYILLFPINVVFFFLFPNITDPPSKSKATVMLIIVIASMIGLIVAILAFEYSLLVHHKLKFHFLSLINALILALP